MTESLNFKAEKDRITSRTKGLSKDDIGRWIDSRFLNYSGEIVHDSLGFLLGTEFTGIGRMGDYSDYPPDTFLSDAYRKGDNCFRTKFEDVLRDRLEDRIKGISPQNKDNIGYVFHGVSSIGIGRVNPLVPTLILLTDKKYDFDNCSSDFLIPPSYDTTNLYVHTIQRLSSLQHPSLTAEFWDKFLDDERTFSCAVSPKSLDGIEHVRRIARYFYKVNENRALRVASDIFHHYLWSKDKPTPQELLDIEPAYRGLSELKQVVDEAFREVAKNSSTDQVAQKLIDILKNCSGSALIRLKMPTLGSRTSSQ